MHLGNEAPAKKLFGNAATFVDDGLEGIVACHTHLRLIRESRVVFAVGARPGATAVQAAARATHRRVGHEKNDHGAARRGGDFQTHPTCETRGSRSSAAAVQATSPHMLASLALACWPRP